MKNIFLLIISLSHFGFSQECEDIEYSYDQLHSGSYSECEFNIDCIAVWGHCDVGLGGCHYGVNEQNYSSEAVNELAGMWINGDCMEWVCDCAGLPNVQCVNGDCELAYCYDENPEGCFNSGCPDGYECIVNENDCIPSSCGCDEFYGNWNCTEDCGGGSCILSQSLGDINNDNQINVNDIILLVNFILNVDNPTDSEFIAGDYNQDGSLSVIDIINIVNIILHPNHLPAECYIIPEIGPCDGICPTYYYNQNTNECEEYITGCCGVEAFNSMQECQNTCE